MNKHLFNNVDGFFMAVIGAWLSVTAPIWDDWRNILVALTFFIVIALIVASIRMFFESKAPWFLFIAFLFVLAPALAFLELKRLMALINAVDVGYTYTIGATVGLWIFCSFLLGYLSKYTHIEFLSFLGGKNE